MDVLKLRLSARTVTGKKVKRLRRGGVVPVHVYGAGIEPLPLQIEAQVLRRTLPRVGTNIPLSVEIEGREGANTCFVRDVQRHPVTEDVLHVDFMRVDVTRRIHADVPIVLVGEAPAVRRLGGTLLQPLQSLPVESLPMKIPAAIRMDISILEDFDQAIHVGDVPVDPDVTILADPDVLIARVIQPRIEVAEVGEAAEALEADVPEAQVVPEAQA